MSAATDSQRIVAFVRRLDEANGFTSEARRRARDRERLRELHERQRLLHRTFGPDVRCHGSFPCEVDGG